MIVYKTTDKIKIQIEGLTFTVSPLSIHDKNTVQAQMLDGQKKSDLAILNGAIHNAIKLSVKDVEGLFNADGSPYKLVFVDGVMVDESVTDLLNLPISEKMIKVCSTLVNSVPQKFDIEGVSFVEKK